MKINIRQRIFDRFLSRFKNNRSFRNIIYNGSGFVVSTLLTLLATPVLVQQLGTEEYGLWRIALSITGIMGVLESGLVTLIAKYVAEYVSQDDNVKLSGIINLGLIISVIIGVIVTLIIYILSSKITPLFSGNEISNNQIQSVIKVAAFGFLPLLLRSNGLAIQQGLRNFGIWNIFNILQRLTIISTALITSKSSDSIQLVVKNSVLMMWILGLISLLLAFWMIRNRYIKFSIHSLDIISIFSYLSFASITSFGKKVFGTVDRLIVGAVLGLAGVTYYSVISGVAAQFYGFSASLTRALMPATSSFNAKGDTAKIRRYFKFSTLFLLFINIIMGVGLILLSKVFLRIWMGEEFSELVLPAFRILIGVYSIKSIAIPAIKIINGLGMPWVNTLSSLSIGFLTILLIYGLGKSYGLVGTAWAHIVSLIDIIIIVFVASRLKLSAANNKNSSLV